MDEQGPAPGRLAPGAARANLTVNLAAARAEGADLDAALLAISQVLRENSAPAVR